MVHGPSKGRKLQDQLLRDTRPRLITIHNLHFSEGSLTRLQEIKDTLFLVVHQLRYLPTAKAPARGNHHRINMDLQCHGKLTSNGHL
jgi:hypothetical protein